jgi:uncharacterized protein YndB with AHSA1/START domain
MKVLFESDYPLTDEACKEATGKSLSDWFAAIEARPELKGKRREAINMWLYPEIGRTKDTWWPTTLWVEHERKNGIVQKDGRIEGYNICVTKKIAAPLEKVYAAWTLGSLDWFEDSPSLAEDKSIKDSTGNEGIALRVRENKDLRYKWTSGGRPDETQVDVTFAAEGGKTMLTLTHNRIQTREEADGLRRAWSEAFVRLKALLEG